MNKDELKGIIEAILFASGDPLSIENLSKMLEIYPDATESLLEEINDDYLDDKRGIYILRFDDKVQLATKPQYSNQVKKLATVNERQTLSKGALECLAIIAYKQPVTRVEIDEIRGVSSEYVLNKLLERNFILILGRKDVPGRPRLYGTSDEFLKQFGLSNLKAFKSDEEYEKLMLELENIKSNEVEEENKNEEQIITNNISDIEEESDSNLE